MRLDTIITGIVMLLVGIGIGYMLAVGELMMKTRTAFDAVAADVAATKLELTVRVLAKKYSWHFHYSGDDGVFGRVSQEAMSEVNPVGLDHSDPEAADDVVASELVLPCQKTVGLIVTSADLIHALGHLEGDFEAVTVPGVKTTKALKTPKTPRAGRLECVQLCGPGFRDHHAPYRFVTPGDYQDWLARQGELAKRRKTEGAASNR